MKHERIEYGLSSESVVECLDKLEQALQSNCNILNVGLHFDGWVLLWGMMWDTISTQDGASLLDPRAIQWWIPLLSLIASPDPRAMTLIERLRSNSLPIDFFKASMTDGETLTFKSKQEK